jgi:hypothetical protein
MKPGGRRNSTEREHEHSMAAAAAGLRGREARQILQLVAGRRPPRRSETTIAKAPICINA